VNHWNLKKTDSMRMLPSPLFAWIRLLTFNFKTFLSWSYFFRLCPCSVIFTFIPCLLKSIFLLSINTILLVKIEMRSNFIYCHLTPEGPNLKFNPRGTNGVSNAIFVWRIQNRLISKIFWFHHDSRKKMTHIGFSTSRKPREVVSYESWLIFEKSRFMTYIWLTNIRYA